ncbi:MAG: sialidase family protein [Abditibacteriaceae bacterium]
MKKLILPFLCLLAIAFFVTQFFLIKPPKPMVSYQWDSAPHVILSALQGAHDPKLFFDAQGKLSVLAVGRNLKQSQLQLFTSQDNGKIFSSSVPVSGKGVPLDSHGENAPILVKAEDGQLVLWGQKNSGGGTDVVCASSSNDGKSFSKPIRINDGNLKSSAYLGHFAVTPKVLLAAWLDGRDDAHDGTTSLYSASSSDKGKTWQKNVRIAQSVCPCCRPDVLALPDGKIVVAWRKVFPGQIRDMVSAVSIDNGKSWSAPRGIAVDNWHIMGCPETGPRLAVIGKRMFAAWYSKGTGKNLGIRFSWSDDGGATWRVPSIISKGLQDAGHPDIFTDAKNVYVAFRADDPRTVKDKSTFKTYVAQVQKDGKFLYIDEIPGSQAANFPSVISDRNGQVWVAWNDNGKVWISHGTRINQ